MHFHPLITLFSTDYHSEFSEAVGILYTWSHLSLKFTRKEQRTRHSEEQIDIRIQIST